ncbi:MAG: lytic transglycosylase domain-containing protein [Chitinophagaceae bacterium]
MNKFVCNITLFLAGSLFGILVISQLAFKEHDKKMPTKNKPLGIAEVPDLPGKMDFAGEQVPLDRWEVKERMDRELLFNFHNKPGILYMLKLANRHFPVISERLKANGVPDDFKYLCVAESNLESTARSRAGAISFWQFMDYTAPGYQLTVNQQVDQRYDLEKATDAACRYLKQAYNKFGNWTAAAASYNCGMGGYSSQAGFQNSNLYYDLYLPEETNRYIFRIMAFKHLMSNAEELGFRLHENEKYQPLPFKLVEVTNSIPDLAKFATQNGTSYKILKLMNPWIRGRSITVAPKKEIVLRLPV